jgi:Na+-translocating ferredoxin:NAD+ oxidoreductase RnfD subunit
MSKPSVGRSNFGGSDWLLPLILLPLYFAVSGKFGQKFAAAAGLSIATGVACWFVALLQQPAGTDVKAADIPFCWSLFLLFPMFCPLGLPLWIIPPLLVLAYLISITSFGGFCRHFFNPVAVAVVLMLVGYGYTASLSASKPILPEGAGYRAWSAGVPPARPLWFYYAAIAPENLLSVAMSADLPAMPGSAYTLPLLVLTMILALVFGRGRAWFITLLLTVPGFTAIAANSGMLSFSPLHPLLLGLGPALMLAAVVDYHSLPARNSEQIVYGLVFSALLLVFSVGSVNSLAPVYALLLMQVLSPLLCDLLLRQKGGAR